MLSRIKFEIAPLVNEILNQLPAEVWTSTSTTFMDPAMAGGQFVREVERRLLEAGHSKKNVAGRVFGCEQYEHQVQYAVNKHKLTGKYSVTNFLEQDFKDMKFDVIVGNPPYQDGTKDGGQNKIYDPFCKKSLDLLNENGIIAFLTPTSVLKDSKRFSLVNQPGLKIVDFTADHHFNVGIQICWWMIDKNYAGNVTVKHSNNEITTQSNNSVIYDQSKINKDFVMLYERLKAVTDKPTDRMFMQNAVDTKTGRGLVADSVFQYPVYKIDNGSKKLVQYNKPKPKFHQKLKFIISMTKGFSDSAITVDTDDYDVAHLCTEVANNTEVENIKSFIFSDYFIKHSELWKQVDGYGYNYSLKHLPPFDKTKAWDSVSVKNFLESV